MNIDTSTTEVLTLKDLVDRFCAKYGFTGADREDLESLLNKFMHQGATRVIQFIERDDFGMPTITGEGL